jgi:diguanylate cyclase
MELLLKKKSKDGNIVPFEVKELSEKLRDREEKQQFLLLAVRALLFLIKDFSLDLKEIDADSFKKRMDGFIEKIMSGKKTKTVQSVFEKHKKMISLHIKRQKEYINEREKEFKDIIELLTKAMATVDAENRFFNQKIYEQSERIEQITLLDDIKKIKGALEQEIRQVRETVREKQSHDRKQIEMLSDQVKSLDTYLEKARMESLKDGLTGVYNRRAFDSYIMNIMERNSVTNSPFSILILDIDNFKQINATYGHTLGDRILLALVQKCKEMTRKEDYLARYGGDEFVVVLRGSSPKSALKKAKQICGTIASTRYSAGDMKGDLKLSFAISVGVAAYTEGDSVATLTERAEKALNEAKRSGKGGVASEKDLNRNLDYQ